MSELMRELEDELTDGWFLELMGRVLEAGEEAQGRGRALGRGDLLYARGGTIHSVQVSGRER